MTLKDYHFRYEEYASLEELNSEDRELACAAKDALKGSYAPYSKFNVGAAVRLDDGTIVKGSNQENAAFPSGLCAERTAMFSASANFPDRIMVSIAIAAGRDGSLTPEPATPCGACRQVMAEYQTKGKTPLSIILVGADKVLKFSRVDDILPFIFDLL